MSAIVKFVYIDCGVTRRKEIANRKALQQLWSVCTLYLVAKIKDVYRGQPRVRRGVEVGGVEY